MTNNYNKKKILLIEDNIGDIKLIEEAIKANRLNVELSVLDDGEKAHQYYRNIMKTDYEDLPDLIICDLNLPRFKGCLLYTSPSPRDLSTSRMPSSA